MTITLPPRFDVLNHELLDDPYPIYARLRNAGPLCRGGPGTWVVTRHAPIARLLRDPALGHGGPRHERPTPIGGGAASDTVTRLVASIGPNQELTRVVSGLDALSHPRVRHLLSRALRLAIGPDMGREIWHIADGLIDRAVDVGRLDVVADYAVPLQIAIASLLLGIPETDRSEVARLATSLGRSIILVPFVDEKRGKGEAEASLLREYVSGLLTDRKRRRGPDLISRLLDVRHGDERLDDDEIVDNSIFLLFAGFETSIHLVAGGCVALTHFPDEMGRLRRDRSLLPTALEEFLRYDAPLQWIVREVSAPVEIEGRRIRAGRVLLLLLASANRDERCFSAADSLDVGRSPNPHLSFGGGPHHCLGTALVRIHGSIAFRRLLDRSRTLELARCPVVRPHPNVRGYASVEIALKPT